EAGRQLQEGMSMNKTVMEFDLRLTDIGQENEYAINQILHNNRERVRNAICQPLKAVKTTETGSDHYLAED
ncbi:hypothetical protein chiPu_0024808, partial [Chiloscyllium punctatum]|nr:hypothetical protein [Chiloscyllium punctatum]